VNERTLASRTPAAAILGAGLFFGVLVGWGANVILTDTASTESYDRFRDGARGPAGRGRTPGTRAGVRDGTGEGGDPHDAAGGRDPRESIVKVHFMKKFVAALTTPPANNWPNPQWQPLLKEGEELSCANCHDATSINMEQMKGMDPGSEAAEPYRRDPRFMVPLMTKWVRKLNAEHGDKLAREVTCNDCHRYDPMTGYRGIPPLMDNFVAALSEPPKNGDPNPDWKPLLKEPDPKAKLCAECHGEEVGGMLANALSDPRNFPRVGRFREDRALMVDLMERWVKQLNRKLGDRLRKAVVCIDCHATDPRR